jgi:hypothetical protein
MLASNGTSLYWSTLSASVTGSDTQIQFNDGGSLNATAGFTFDKTTNTVSIGSATVNSTNYTGTANFAVGAFNANQLGGYAATSYVRTSGNFVISGNNVFTGAQTSFGDTVKVGSYLTINMQSVATGSITMSNGYANTIIGFGSATFYGTIFGANTYGVNTSISANGLFVGANVVANSTQITVGNTSLYTSINSTAVNTSSINTSGNASIGGNLTVAGDLTISGNVTTINANNLSIVDNMIYLNSNSTNSNPDIGFAANYNDGTYHHTGFFRDHSTGVWKVFDGYLPEPDASPFIDQSNNSFNIAPFQANNIYVGNTTSYGTITATSFSGTSNNSTYLNGQLASYYTNANNITSGTLPDGRLSSAVVNTSGNFTVAGNLNFTGTNNYFSSIRVGANTVVNTTALFTGNTTVNTNIAAGQISISGATINATNYSGTANNANNLGGAAASVYVNTSANFTVAGNLNFTGTNNYFSALYAGANSVVNTTTHFVGNTTVNTSVTAGQISISGVTVNSTIYQGTANNSTYLNGQLASYYTNANNITSGTLPYAQLGANVVNTSGSFTITGTQTFQANLIVGNSTVNVATTNSSITINAGNTASLNGSSLAVGNSTVNAVANTTGFFVNGLAIYTNATNISTGTLSPNVGGTGLNSFAVGDIIVANGSATLTKLSIGTNGYVLQSNGTSLVYGTLDGGSF